MYITPGLHSFLMHFCVFVDYVIRWNTFKTIIMIFAKITMCQWVLVWIQPVKNVILSKCIINSHRKPDSYVISRYFKVQEQGLRNQNLSKKYKYWNKIVTSPDSFWHIWSVFNTSIKCQYNSKLMLQSKNAIILDL